MKRHFYILSLLLVLTGCESFLDSEDYTKKNTGNFPRTVEDANQMVTGIYSTLSAAISNPQHTHFYAAELASDDRFGGGVKMTKICRG